ISTDLEKGIIHSLPYQIFPMEKAVDAFRFMSHGKHIGKILLSNYYQSNKEYLESLNEVNMVNNNKQKNIYLITGGFSGIGLLINKWMIMEKEIKSMILVGRSGNSKLGIPIIQNKGNNERTKL